MKKIFLLVFVATIAISAFAVGADDDNQPLSFWMFKKLEDAQDVFSALAMSNFSGILVNAEAMQRVTKIEGFAKRSDAAPYRRQVQLFELANQELIRAAQEKNLEAATLAFNQLTLSCVNCHKVMRDKK